MTNPSEATMSQPSQPLRVVTDNGKVHCRKWDTCHNWVNLGTKTGLCRPCVTEAWRTGEFKHPANPHAEPRKAEVEAVAGLARRMLRRATAAAKDEDPGRGLKALLELQAQLAGAIREVGDDLVAVYGSTVLAQELGMNKTAVDNRWGPRDASGKRVRNQQSESE